MKEKLHNHLTELSKNIDILNEQGANSEILILLDKIVSLESNSILYFDELEPETINVLSIIINLADNVCKDRSANSDENFKSLSTLVDSLETLYKQKRIILDNEEKEFV